MPVEFAPRKLAFTPETLELLTRAVAVELVSTCGDHLVQHSELLEECAEAATASIVMDFAWPMEPVHEAMRIALACALVELTPMSAG